MPPHKVATPLAHQIQVEFVAIMGEFVGTFLFLFFAFMGTQIANLATPAGPGPDLIQLLYISLSFGFSLAVNAWVFFRISGGLFNPVVTLSMVLIGAVKIPRGIGAIICQIIGGIAAAGLAKGLIPGHGPLKFGVSLAPGMSVVQGLFLEVFLTSLLIFTILLLAAEKHKATFIAPVGIGLALFVAELAGVFFTGGALNPARAFGPAVVQRSFYHYHWIYWVGPILGALLATGFYGLNKVLDYEEANPGQDAADDPEWDADQAAEQRKEEGREEDRNSRRNSQNQSSARRSKELEDRNAGHNVSGHRKDAPPSAWDGSHGQHGPSAAWQTQQQPQVTMVDPQVNAQSRQRISRREILNGPHQGRH